jgi:ATPase family associated with various cellular activities (AAA)
MAARTVASSCDALSIVVDGNALLSAGDTAGASLRELLEAVKNQASFARSFWVLTRLLSPFFAMRQPTMIIIDDADALISSRFPITSTEDITVYTPTSVHCGLYVLLEAMREAHPNVSVIVTTSLPLSRVDPAMLDRFVFSSHLFSPLPLFFKASLLSSSSTEQNRLHCRP